TWDRKLQYSFSSHQVSFCFQSTVAILPELAFRSHAIIAITRGTANRVTENRRCTRHVAIVAMLARRATQAMGFRRHKRPAPREARVPSIYSTIPLPASLIRLAWLSHGDVPYEEDNSHDNAL